MALPTIDPTPPETAAMNALRVERPSPACAVVTIDRPARRNAMTFAMWSRLAEIFEALGQEEALRAVILTGAGGAFCAGADIKEFEAVRSTPETARRYDEAVDRCNRAISTCLKATFAAVSGPAYGGGCGLAAACDFRVADRTAFFAIPAARLGIVYGIEETRAIYDTVGLTAAKEMLFSGRRYDAAAAARIGLVSHPCEEDALGAALALAEELSASAPLTIAGAKAVLEALTAGETPERVARVHDIVERAMSSEDYGEGRRAFVEKREPRFRGR